MLTWALTFFVLGVIAAVFGFGGVVGVAASIAKLIFIICLVLVVIFSALAFRQYKKQTN
ncbi:MULTISPECIES: DUF1328 family protein [Paraglaciecola]|mgnify:CR=1 FL=1|jgi:uncharacterized membrane protein YtjA (UPF0391 family)|uniref:UPF0391 membrane protein FX988_02445 n=4 Tax=Paraglaciecola TaxID=1621534 RepID=A0A857JNP6_9ALTE|nr:MULTISPECIES: DUF1328 family protein [Paraglaciecola]AEE21144.1 protein of unknown function DUF1328 [Glaciecola sp. 4H-3-7+YE-5]MBN27259.1 DUF1328 domain-containing protein [Alteromonadaceae bacterium]MBJ2136904.1 DUF1328 domain-containing protein [Paraglaciecola chathamensis]MBU3017043.1 DUF1328 domain-containing protein [Paraglaciecola agarilytica]MDO6560543.1 DUF1328 family protein [Paraglaciecola chathamensis]|tara:strand:+ start:1494 stop:1670 length:177 start_codon:yes stop_codon:yes gene_type:complete